MVRRYGAGRRRRFGRRTWKRAGTYRRRPRFVGRGYNRRVAGLQVGKSEWKSVDTAIYADYGLTGDVVTLNGIAPGSGIGQRVGVKVRLRKVVADLTAMTKAAVTVSCGGRVMLVYDKQTNASAPSVGDVLDIVPGLHNEDSPLKLENRSRFVVLRDWHFRTSPEGQQGDMIKHRMIWRGVLPTVYNNIGGGTVADIVSGGLFLVVFGSNVAGNDGQLSGTLRVRYDDQ